MEISIDESIAIVRVDFFFTHWVKKFAVFLVHFS